MEKNISKLRKTRVWGPGALFWYLFRSFKKGLYNQTMFEQKHERTEWGEYFNKNELKL